MRLENWDNRLVKFVVDHNGLEYEWGETDCAQLVRSALYAMYGRDLWHDHVGTWTTKTGAIRVLNKLDVEDILEKTGAFRITRPFSTSGDIAFNPPTNDHDIISLSILVPTRKALMSTPEEGVHYIDALLLPQSTRYWRYE